MTKTTTTRAIPKGALVAALATAIVMPLVLAAQSPLLAWRDPIYIAAGFAGILALAFLLIQPILISGRMPFVHPHTARRMHAWVGAALFGTVVLHVAGLWITSPPDVIDVLLLRSPTPFSLWGVAAMWAVFATAFLAIFRKRLGISPKVWRRAHKTCALIIVTGTVGHAMLITGTMETISKAVLCTLVIAATAAAVLNWRGARRR